VDWLHLVQNRYKMRAVFKTVVNIRVPKIPTLFRLTEGLSVTQEGLCPMALGDRSVSGMPTGLVGKQRAKKQQGVERQRNYIY
jgi:hypothetical protein